MTEQQKRQIAFCRAKGASIPAIVDMVGLPVGTVKSYCRRQKEDERPAQRCQYCGSPVIQTEGRKVKHFCDQRCYYRWWYMQEQRTRTVYEKVCDHCGKRFSVPSKKGQRYCSRDCFHAARRLGGHSG